MYFISEIYWDKGGRSVNQDSVLLQEVMLGRERIWFGAVCDGIGGLSQGETASGYAAEQLTNWFHVEAVPSIAVGNGRMRIIRAGIRNLYFIYENLKKYAERENISLGTTATIVLLYRRRYLLWHLGDSRAYLIGKNHTIQLTKDHARGPCCLLKCISSFGWQKPDILTGKVRKGQAVMIGSDGFCRNVTQKELGESFGSKKLSGQQMQRRLKEIADRAIKKGEKDNLTALAVHLE